MKYACILLLFSAGMINFSCSKNYLEKPALGQLDEASLANKKGVEGLLIGAYSLLDGYGSSKSTLYGASAASNWIYGSITGTEAHKGSRDNDIPEITVLARFEATANDPLLAAKWGVVYDGVQRANDVLRVMKNANDISVEDQHKITAEARFLRAHYHFEAKKMWNNVPYIDESITYAANNYRIGNERDIWPDIENDLKYAVDSLPESQNEIGRANKYTAMALLAKAYLFQGIGKYALAKPLLEAIINSGKFHLAEFYSENFNAGTKNQSESIFAVQSSVNDGANGLNGNFGDALNFPADDYSFTSCCGFFQPTSYLVNHFKTLSTGLPDYNNFNTAIKDDEVVEPGDEFIPYDGPLDARLDWTVGRRGIPYLDWGIHPSSAIWVRERNNYGPYNPIKSSFYRANQGSLTENSWANLTANNVNLIRYADVLLWAAETEVEIGSLDQAENYVNEIRERAANAAGWVHTYKDPANPFAGFTTTPAAKYSVQQYPVGYFVLKGQEFSRDAVRLERMLELGMEGHRFFDLVRWGIAEKEINNYLQQESKRRTYLQGVIFKKCNEYFPIPQLQIDLSAGADGIPKMKQNPPCY